MLSEYESKLLETSASGYLKKPRSRIPFHQIIDDFFHGMNFKDKTILDLGPGHFDLAEIISERGGTVVSVDNDPAIVALGKSRGFECIQGDIRNLNSIITNRLFDGVFCKFSMNAYWFHSFEENRDFVNQIFQVMAPGAWSWIAPWNGGTRVFEFGTLDVLRAQEEVFISCGFTHYELTQLEAKRYGVHGLTANRPVFTFNLDNLADLSNIPPHEVTPKSIVRNLIDSSGVLQFANESFENEKGRLRLIWRKVVRRLTHFQR